MGKQKLVNLLTEVCKKRWHSSITVLKTTGLENCRVKSVTGHTSDKSIKSLIARPTLEQQFESSAIVSRFIIKHNSDQLSLAGVSLEAILSLVVK